MGIVVRKPGMCTTVQDLGRFGYQGSGFTPSGVMDRRAYRIANILVGNPEDSCVLEFALVGPELRFTTNTFIALTGADCSATLNGKPAPRYRVLAVPRGSVLSFGEPRNGVYGYIAIASQLRIEEVMGSRSTNMKSGIGGYNGRKLAHGDYISFMRKNVDYLPYLASRQLDPEDYGGDGTRLRVVPGPQEDMFSDEGIRSFYGNEFVLTAQCDRMGYRLDGPEVGTVAGSDIISDGIAFGAVQIPSHGRPIIMLADRQTTGGYAKIATVASVDIPKLVQCRPGDAVMFERISLDQAQDLYNETVREYGKIAKRVTRPSVETISPRKAARRLTPILLAQAEKAEDETLWINRGQRGAAHDGRKDTRGN